MTVTVEREGTPAPVDTTENTTGTMRIANYTGDTTVKWDRRDPVSTEAARAAFLAAKERGHLAYRVDHSGDRGNEVIRTFDPEAEHIVLMPQTVGG